VMDQIWIWYPVIWGPVVNGLIGETGPTVRMVICREQRYVVVLIVEGLILHLVLLDITLSLDLRKILLLELEPSRQIIITTLDLDLLIPVQVLIQDLLDIILALALLLVLTLIPDLIIQVLDTILDQALIPDLVITLDLLVQDLSQSFVMAHNQLNTKLVIIVTVVVAIILNLVIPVLGAIGEIMANAHYLVEEVL
jgi:hypothetical protein